MSKDSRLATTALQILFLKRIFNLFYPFLFLAWKMVVLHPEKTSNKRHEINMVYSEIVYINLKVGGISGCTELLMRLMEKTVPDSLVQQNNVYLLLIIFYLCHTDGGLNRKHRI